MGFIIRRLNGDLRNFLCFLVLRDIDVRQGKVHGRVWWVNPPDFGHFLDFGSEFLICLYLYFALVQFLFWFVCSTTDGRLGHWDRERIFLCLVLWWILNERWLSDGFCAVTQNVAETEIFRTLCELMLFYHLSFFRIKFDCFLSFFFKTLQSIEGWGICSVWLPTYIVIQCDGWTSQKINNWPIYTRSCHWDVGVVHIGHETCLRQT